jgi:hypothetical protein
VLVAGMMSECPVVGEIRAYRESWGVPMRVIDCGWFRLPARGGRSRMAQAVIATPVGVTGLVLYDLEDFERWYPRVQP